MIYSSNQHRHDVLLTLSPISRNLLEICNQIRSNLSNEVRIICSRRWFVNDIIPYNQGRFFFLGYKYISGEF